MLFLDLNQSEAMFFVLFLRKRLRKCCLQPVLKARNGARQMLEDMKMHKKMQKMLQIRFLILSLQRKFTLIAAPVRCARES